MGIEQWHRDEAGNFMGVGETLATLPPGIYEPVQVPPLGLVWVPIEARDDLLIRFDDSVSTNVVDEIETFWGEEEAFRRYSLPFKRGILLHGPPGSGKSSTVRLIANAVVKRGGYVISWSRPAVLIAAMRQLRQAHKGVPVVVLMEDLDSILERYDESATLNLLDGAESVDKVVFIATTNYPERLAERIRNRPSRFDRRVLVPHPSRAARRQYLDTLVREGDDFDLDRYVSDSDGMSLAHLKELFVSTAILGADYATTLRDLRGMGHAASSVEDTGFERPGTYA